MSQADFLAAARPAAKIVHDGKTSPAAVSTALPLQALALLPALQREAARDLHHWRLLAASPQFCVALMLEGAIVLGLGTHASLGAGFAWALAVLLGIAALTRNHIRGISRIPRQAPLADGVRELRRLLFALGLAWGSGAYLLLPAPLLAVVFAAGPFLTAALIFKNRTSATAFGAPAAVLTAGAVFFQDALHSAAGLNHLARVSIAGLSMLQCAIAQA